MRTSIFLAAALAGIANAKDSSSSTIVGYFIPSWAPTTQLGGQTSTAASLAGINAEAATYHVGCVKDAPKSDCNYPKSWTIIQGASTVSVTGEYIYSTTDNSQNYDITVTQSWECSLKASTESASCTMSIGMDGSLDGGKYQSSSSTAATYTTAPISDTYYKLTVTGGIDSYTAPEATKTPGAAAAGPAAAFVTAGPMVAAAVVALL
ncbi:hypothetical protein PENANT_c005G05646 [Penicillium antarcticum]|uniref:Ig-like domain-containing protein n=1 Tax=Penicillium antarcticum TaxID=416450 RepID=A0A1V6QFI2_9EURO|nr:uncharacterized protein N7508_007771 [Penicillium antarcticum]KAJ5297522.1 hypothetical protein N7508_007771 [Penicillium antarcticum]OQD87737.1 hypothetical protein PENANT_c005G05646 [Penicillium antarcticum]